MSAAQTDQTSSLAASRRRPRVLAAVVAVLVLVVLPHHRAVAEIELRLHRVESFIPVFEVKKEMNARYRRELDAIFDELHMNMMKGENFNCAAQIAEETHWLVNYTDRSDEVQRRMSDLKRVLATPGRAAMSGQDPRDGSFAPCMETWIWRFFRSVDPLKNMARRGEIPRVPLKIWEPVDSPEEITALMGDLLVSDLGGGHNKRMELNLAITALGQLLWLDETASVFPTHLDREALADALREFVDEHWQDPATGYWGAWYRDGDAIRKTNDLSITFHIISYRGGEVALEKEIGRTTGAIRNVRYPFGWDTGGMQNNHHAYDIARIANLTWEDLDPAARSHASANLFLMLARSLAHSMTGEGKFDARPFTTVAEAYYFGISFFEEVGLFVDDNRHGLAIKLTDAKRLAQQIDENLDRLDPSDPWVAQARWKLERVME
jgi:hypothetical protein